jgi:elongation factor Ts
MSNLITAEVIKQLREKSGAGMVECKNALAEAGGEMEIAIEILRKKGVLKAAKRGDRETKEGVIKVAVSEDGKSGFILEVDSETDFVARNEQFKNFTNEVINLLKENKPASQEELMALMMRDGHSVQNNLDNLISVIGEKLEIKRFAILSSLGIVAAYSHMAGRIGVLAALSGANQEELARDIAMQIAASNPKYIYPADVPPAEINKEKEIYAEQLKKEGKPENMIEKIVAGKINKYFEEVCLLKQEFIKDDTKRVEDILGEIKVEKFIRYSL